MAVCSYAASLLALQNTIASQQSACDYEYGYLHQNAHTAFASQVEQGARGCDALRLCTHSSTSSSTAALPCSVPICTSCGVAVGSLRCSKPVSVAVGVVVSKHGRSLQNHSITRLTWLAHAYHSMCTLQNERNHANSITVACVYVTSIHAMLRHGGCCITVDRTAPSGGLHSTLSGCQQETRHLSGLRWLYVQHIVGPLDDRCAAGVEDVCDEFDWFFATRLRLPTAVCST